MLCKIESTTPFNLGEIKEEIILDKINIKYNLLIQPGNNTEMLISYGNGGSFLFSYPIVLNFYSNDSLIINYYSKGNMEIRGIKLNPDSNNDLKCDNLKNLKKCIVTKDHFNGKQDGYFYTHHKNYDEKYIISYELSPIQVILPKDKKMIIRISNKDNEKTINIGQKGILSLITDYKDIQNIFESSDIEEKTSNKAIFSDNINNDYTSNCYLWKPEGEKLRLICKFDDSIKGQNIKLNKYSFVYKDYTITILSETYVNITQLNSDISFLYSDKQEIKIDDKKNEYSLIFKKGVYNKEPLILFKEDMILKNTYLDCIEEIKEIKCTIKKDKLLQLLSVNNEIFYLSHMTGNNGILAFNDVLDIKVKYENVAKKDIYLSLTKLLTPKIDKNSFFIFETNITDIAQLTTNYFTIDTKTNDIIKCLFKKNSEQKEDKLLLVCNGESKSTYSFSITEKINLDNANILYNFKIAENKEIYTIDVSNEEGAKIISVYPESLDFSSNDKLILKYQTENPEKLIDIKLNNDSSSVLDCINKIGVKECTVPKNHFNESGYYYTYHKNGFGDISISYEIPRIFITLNNEKKDDGSKDKNYTGFIIAAGVLGLILIIIIIYLIVRCIRRRNSDLDSFSKKIDKLFGDDGNVELQPDGEMLE